MDRILLPTLYSHITLNINDIQQGARPMSISIAMTTHNAVRASFIQAGDLLRQMKKIKGYLYEQYIQKQ